MGSMVLLLLFAAMSFAPREAASVAFSPDGKTIAVGGWREVRLLDAATQQEVGKLAATSDMVRALAFSRDGRRLAIAGGSPARFGEVQVWDVASRSQIIQWRGHDDCIYAVAFSPDGNRLATGSYDKLVKIWNAADGESGGGVRLDGAGSALRTLKEHSDAVLAVAFSPDGTRIASASADRTVKVWDAATGVRLFTLSEATDGVQALAFHPNGRQIAAAGADKSIRVWDITANSGELARSVVAHEDTILQLAYSPDGSRLASSSADRSVKIWDAHTLTELHSNKGPDWVVGLAYSPDGSLVAAGRFDGSVVLVEGR